jgi:hypothetical protein
MPVDAAAELDLDAAARGIGENTYFEVDSNLARGVPQTTSARS